MCFSSSDFSLFASNAIQLHSDDGEKKNNSLKTILAITTHTIRYNIYKSNAIFGMQGKISIFFLEKIQNIFLVKISCTATAHSGTQCECIFNLQRKNEFLMENIVYSMEKYSSNLHILGLTIKYSNFWDFDITKCIAFRKIYSEECKANGSACSHDLYIKTSKNSSTKLIFHTFYTNCWQLNNTFYSILKYPIANMKISWIAKRLLGGREGKTEWKHE